MRLPDQRTLVRKQVILSGLTLFFFIVLFIGFMRLQVNKKNLYMQKSINNSIRKIDLYPVRGLIRDRNGKILVDNRPSFAVAVIPKVVSDTTIQVLASHFSMDANEIRKKIHREYGFRPVIIARDIPQTELIYLEENKLELPGVVNVVESKRFYGKDIRSPHILGTIGEVTPEEHKKHPELTIGDLTGKSGLEKQYDSELRGVKGVRYLRVDASGKELGLYDANRNVPPVHGSDLFLELDYNLQEFADSLFGDKRGALVAIDVRSGGILTMVSKPDYDPSLLSGKIDPKIWNKLLNDPSHPLYSRAIQSTYPPGSTYKIVAAIAALQEKIITPQWKAFCPGYFKLGRRTIHCWNTAGHGQVDLEGAIKGSCNVYFYQLGLKIGLDIWNKYSLLLGFGRRTDIDVPNESKGLVPSKAYFDRIYGKNGWTRGNLANLAIGQGELLTTPLQIAQFVMILANKGVYHSPHLVSHIHQYQPKKDTAFPANTKYINGISNDVYNFVREGMHQVVNGGTGWRAKVPHIDMAGKTGTAQNPHGEPHAWFMGFAPYKLPEIAIAVLVENGGSGGGVAAPIARKFLEKYFYGKELPTPIVKKAEPEIEPLPVLVPDLLQPLQIPAPGDTLTP